MFVNLQRLLPRAFPSHEIAFKGCWARSYDSSLSILIPSTPRHTYR